MTRGDKFIREMVEKGADVKRLWEFVETGECMDNDTITCDDCPFRSSSCVDHNILVEYFKEEIEEENVQPVSQAEVSSASDGYDPLKMFYQIAKKYFGSSTPQDLELAIQKQREQNDIVCKGLVSSLRNEKERLEKENKWLRSDRALAWGENEKNCELNHKLRKENEELLALLKSGNSVKTVD